LSLFRFAVSHGKLNWPPISFTTHAKQFPSYRVEHFLGNSGSPLDCIPPVLQENCAEKMVHEVLTGRTSLLSTNHSI